MIHVYPIAGRGHVLEGLGCWCGPVLEMRDAAGKLLVVPRVQHGAEEVRAKDAKDAKGEEGAVLGIDRGLHTGGND